MVVQHYALLAAEHSAPPDWIVEGLEPTTYRGRVTHADQATATGRALGELVDLPAVVARIRRAGS